MWILFLFLIWPNGAITATQQQFTHETACYATISAMQNPINWALHWPEGNQPQAVGYCIKDAVNQPLRP